MSAFDEPDAATYACPICGAVGCQFEIERQIARRVNPTLPQSVQPRLDSCYLSGSRDYQSLGRRTASRITLTDFVYSDGYCREAFELVDRGGGCVGTSKWHQSFDGRLRMVAERISLYWIRDLFDSEAVHTSSLEADNVRRVSEVEGRAIEDALTSEQRTSNDRSFFSSGVA